MLFGLKEIALISSVFMYQPSLVDEVPTTNDPVVAIEELGCLVKNIYFEANSEPRKGQVAVALVALNRVASENYPDTICGVVTEDRGPKKHDCQFSWYCDGNSDEVPENAAKDLIGVAITAIRKHTDDNLKGATHYYAHQLVRPAWASKITKIAQIGGHTFLKE